jgi:hypothetical protein
VTAELSSRRASGRKAGSLFGIGYGKRDLNQGQGWLREGQHVAGMLGGRGGFGTAALCALGIIGSAAAATGRSAVGTRLRGAGLSAELAELMSQKQQASRAET